MKTADLRGGNCSGKEVTRDKAIRAYVSDTVIIPMSMHLGAPSAPCVQKGDYVRVGQVIGEPVGGLGLPVHASVSGEVLSVEPMIQLGASPVMCVTIKNDFRDEWAELQGLGNVESVAPEKIIPAIKAAGICGMGGATFPSHIKLCIPEGKVCETIIINGAECETHLTSDYRLMLEKPQRVVDGLRACMRALGVSKGVIAIEEDKPLAIEAMRKAASGREGINVISLPSRYPQGSEKQLILTVTGREVPSGKLPIDAGVLVFNAATASAIADAVIDGKPLIERVTTVTGCVKEPGNLLLRIGTSVGDAIRACGGYSEDPGKVILGGAMTGVCAPNDGVSITKGSGGVLVLNEAQSRAYEEKPCIRCARCVQACPIGLEPYLLRYYVGKNDLDSAAKHSVMDCILCGSCAYVCPARRWLTASFRVAKQELAQRARRGK